MGRGVDFAEKANLKSIEEEEGYQEGWREKLL